MESIKLNGTELNVNEIESKSIDELLHHIYLNFNTSHHLVSSIKIDGEEIFDIPSTNIKRKPIDQIEMVEVKTNHIREILNETLEDLLSYTDSIISLSRSIYTQKNNFERAMKFDRLIEWLQVFVDSVCTIKSKTPLKGEKLITITELECHLRDEIQALSHAKSNDDDRTCEIILSEKVPFIFEGWRDLGIPTLMAAWDN